MKSQDVSHEGYFLLGRVTKPQGVQGELRALFAVDSLEPYAGLKALWVQEAGEVLTRYRIKALRPVQKTEVILKLEGISDRNRAELLRNATLWLPDHQLPSLKEGQFYYHEIIGLPLWDERLGEVGTIARVLEMPAQDVLEVACPGGLVLVPLVDAFILGLDRTAPCLRMRLPEGLLDVYLHPGEDADEL
ncbi:MAG: 16S rRNA processing protein RimM [Bacteroidetes bacterium]|nr:16S rRNA processing protein RimM [Bacteroidota bacterium]